MDLGIRREATVGIIHLEGTGVQKEDDSRSQAERVESKNRSGRACQYLGDEQGKQMKKEQ